MHNQKICSKNWDVHSLFLTLISLFWKHNITLMGSPCCLCVYICIPQQLLNAEPTFMNSDKYRIRGMSSRFLNSYTEIINRTTGVGFSPRDSGNIVHDAYASVSGHVNTRWTVCGHRKEVRSKRSEMEKGVMRTGYFKLFSFLQEKFSSASCIPWQLTLSQRSTSWISPINNTNIAPIFISDTQFVVKGK
jgi:hypothetical protein